MKCQLMKLKKKKQKVQRKTKMVKVGRTTELAAENS